MFELSVACKYLIPRWRQLSVSIISLVSILVIALVVWLIVVFFSVKDGLENSWVDKIIALTAPIRVTPTEKYYNSYYYQADSVSAQSNYTAKSIGEKLYAPQADPYNTEFDEELPTHWPAPDINAQGALKDLVQLVAKSAASLHSAKGIKVTDYETTLANIRLRLVRPSAGPTQQSQQFLDHGTYVGSFDADTPVLAKALLPFTAADFNNLLQMQFVSADNILEDVPDAVHQLEISLLQHRLQAFFQAVNITALKTPANGWRLPQSLLPANAHFKVVVLTKDGAVARITIPNNPNDFKPLPQSMLSPHEQLLSGELSIVNGTRSIKFSNQEPIEIEPWIPLLLEDNTVLHATVDMPSLEQAQRLLSIPFNVHAKIQSNLLQGKVGLGSLEITEATITPRADAKLLVVHAPDNAAITLPQNSAEGDGILLPRSFKDAGALLGDQGYLSYYSPTPSSVQEQRQPIFVAGFYDPGIMPLGGKYILASKDLIGAIRASYNSNESLASNGLNIRFDNLKDAAKIKAELLLALEEAGITPYWHIETYQEYEYTKDLIQQLHSEKNLFSVISLVVIVVACSNIISMLIILVNDKKLEIGIMRSMGATSGSIAAIFGICGMVMGTLGSLIGILAATLTLRYINELVALISKVQGYDLFNPIFYGNTLPSELSVEALAFVVGTTAFISLLAGIVPAVKASMLRPSTILRSE